mmetsp:Transcript_19239/g.42100  ORF Transcript_19239/g.42100 Transcript_19239/m.42100 type:complete len:206 (-) Transcript_19239:142-759(-)|eukprot:CAMPEP_0118944068 /NCGR_PEP_ID=MMETSP1169-20130426/39604_1 /TAXON_ID=36882 /ORGANISM="Pyramimonas obovata, Strain CCMP722" /LENGTH=205 /DNA_ID=CAMNT_0006889481 /DNA_START=117 /DNA_END=734 /DNA_ORIENTATION=-
MVKAEDNPYQLNKLVADCTPGMSERDIKKAAKQQGRPSKRQKDFDLDDYLSRQLKTREERATVVVQGGIVARIEASDDAHVVDEDAPFIVEEAYARPAEEVEAERVQRAQLRQAAFDKYVGKVEQPDSTSPHGEGIEEPTKPLLLEASSHQGSGDGGKHDFRGKRHTSIEPTTGQQPKKQRAKRQRKGALINNHNPSMLSFSDDV